MENSVETLYSRKQAVPSPSNNIDILHKKRERKKSILNFIKLNRSSKNNPGDLEKKPARVDSGHRVGTNMLISKIG